MNGTSFNCFYSFAGSDVPICKLGDRLFLWDNETILARFRSWCNHWLKWVTASSRLPLPAHPQKWQNLHPVTDLLGRRCLRSPSTSAVVVPSTRFRTIGDRAFPAAASRTWTSLPPEVEVTSSRTLLTFKSTPKNLSAFSFFSWCLVFSVQWLQCSALYTLNLWLWLWLWLPDTETLSLRPLNHCNLTW